MASWSLDSLPTCQNEITEEQALIVDSLQDLSKMSSKLLCLMTQPEFRSKELRQIGFMQVKTTQHYTRDFFRQFDCPSSMKAVLIVNVGTRFEQQPLEVISALSQNESMPVILVVLVVPDVDLTESIASSEQETIASREQESNGSAFGKKISELQDELIEVGADDVVVLQGGEPFSRNRLVEAIHRVEIQVQKLRALDQEVSTLQRRLENSKENDTDKRIARQLQMAWWQSMWKLTGNSLPNVPRLDPDLRESLMGQITMQPQRGCDATSDSKLGRGRVEAGVGSYIFAQKLGRGAFGIVYTATDTTRDEADDGRTVAIKVISKKAVSKLSHLMSLDQEFAIVLNMPPHPNVLKAHLALHGESNMYLVMEYAGNTNLHQFILAHISSSGDKKLPDDMCMTILEQMTKSIHHLHANMICHRDIKPANFMIMSSGRTKRLKIIDFGLACTLCGETQMLSQCCGSLPFCAPEVLRSVPYNPFGADIWSLALNFLELSVGPYSIENLLGWVPSHPSDPKVRMNDTEQLESKWAASPRTDNPLVEKAITGMMLLDPKDRLTVAQVISTMGFSPPQPPTRGNMKRVNNIIAPLASDRTVSVRKVINAGVADRTSKSILSLALGEKASIITSCVQRTFDAAMEAGTFGLTVEANRLPIAEIRPFYAEAMETLSALAVGSSAAEAALHGFSSKLVEWPMRDMDFDIITDILCGQLENHDVALTSVALARRVFGQLRPSAVSKYRKDVESNGKVIGSFEDMCGPYEYEDVAQAFRRQLPADLEPYLEELSLAMGGSSSSSLTETLEVNVRQFFEAGAKSAFLLTNVKWISTSQAAQLVETAKVSLSDFEPDVVPELYARALQELDRFRLRRAMYLLGCHSIPDSAASWMRFMLRLQDAVLVGDRAIAPARTMWANCLSCLGSALAVAHNTDVDAGQLLLDGCAALDTQLNDADIDALVSLIPECCIAMRGAHPQAVAEVIQAMRPFTICRRQSST